MIHLALSIASFLFLCWVAYIFLMLFGEALWELTKVAALIGVIVALYFILKSFTVPKVLDDIVGYIAALGIGAAILSVPAVIIFGTRRRMKDGMSFGAALWKTLN
jgi:hypothetical protein